MKKSDIVEGATYRNRGKGRTTRKVIAIGDEYRPVKWFSGSDHPSEPGVRYMQEGKIFRLYLSSFAQWAGSRVED